MKKIVFLCFMIPSFVFAEDVDGPNVFTNYLKGDPITITYIEFDRKTGEDKFDKDGDPVKTTIKVIPINSTNQDSLKK